MEQHRRDIGEKVNRIGGEVERVEGMLREGLRVKAGLEEMMGL